MPKNEVNEIKGENLNEKEPEPNENNQSDDEVFNKIFDKEKQEIFESLIIESEKIKTETDRNRQSIEETHELENTSQPEENLNSRPLLSNKDTQISGKFTRKLITLNLQSKLHIHHMDF